MYGSHDVDGACVDDDDYEACNGCGCVGGAEYIDDDECDDGDVGYGWGGDDVDDDGGYVYGNDGAGEGVEVTSCGSGDVHGDEYGGRVDDDGDDDNDG